MGSVTREKLAQAAGLAAELGIDVWITFVRETAGSGDPALPLILEGGLTWQSALMVGANGCKVAVVGNYDADPLLASGDWDEVIPYVESVRPALLGALAGFRSQDGPTRIAVNYSTSDDKADGLTYGMFLLLQDVLVGTEFEGGLESAEPLLSRLRGQKTPSELSRIRAAIAEGDRLFAEVPEVARVGISERELYDHIQRRMDERGLGYAWDRAGDPIVNFGPDSMIGHGIPSAELFLAPGQVLHIDLGVITDGYSSDVQRCWYVGETVPDEVTQALDGVNAAIDAGAALLRPGSIGHEVDAAARRTIAERGFPEFRHALGHQVGRMAHDGGALLGPAWDRYGQSPFMPARIGEVYTLELGVTVPGRGYVGIEEMVEVTADGCRFLTERQLTMPILAPQS